MAQAGRFKYIGANDHTGYAQAAMALADAMLRAQMSVLWETALQSPATVAYQEWVPDAVIVHTVPEHYPAYLQRERAAGARRVVGHTVWETDRLPAHWPDLINVMDAVIVPTAWNRDVFLQSGVTIPIIVTPHVPRPLQPAQPQDVRFMQQRFPGLAQRYVFYCIGAWQHRKGMDLLVDAFCEAFSADQPVGLVIKTTPFNQDKTLRETGAPQQVLSQQECAALVQKAQTRLGRAAPPIHLVVEDLADADVQALHAAGDCFVSLTRAEGWGLGAFDAARQGKPVVITDWGGPLAFLDAQSAYLVDAQLEPVQMPVPGTSYSTDQRWAAPVHAQAVAALRAVLGNVQGAALRGQRAAHAIRERFQPAAIAQEMAAQILQVPGR